MSEHLDQDDLADVLADEPATGALDHLEKCPLCVASLEQLRASLDLVVAALAALPEPALAEGLAARLDSAIAHERRVVSAGTATNIIPLAATRRRNLLPMAGGLAAAAVLVVGAVVLTSSGGGSGSGSAKSSGVSAQNPTAGIATSNSGRDYARGGVGLAAQLPTLLNGAAGPEASQQTDSTLRVPKAALGAAAADPLAGLRTDAGLARCLVSLTDPEEPGIPLALDYGSYAGTPALVVVLPSPVKNKVYVYFVGAGCNAKNSQVLFFEKIAKP
jgi:hypothetical protein